MEKMNSEIRLHLMSY